MSNERSPLLKPDSDNSAKIETIVKEKYQKLSRSNLALQMQSGLQTENSIVRESKPNGTVQYFLKEGNKDKVPITNNALRERCEAEYETALLISQKVNNCIAEVERLAAGNGWINPWADKRMGEYLDCIEKLTQLPRLADYLTKNIRDPVNGTEKNEVGWVAVVGTPGVICADDTQKTAYKTAVANTGPYATEVGEQKPILEELEKKWSTSEVWGKVGQTFKSLIDLALLVVAAAEIGVGILMLAAVIPTFGASAAVGGALIGVGAVTAGAILAKDAIDNVKGTCKAILGKKVTNDGGIGFKFFKDCYSAIKTTEAETALDEIVTKSNKLSV